MHHFFPSKAKWNWTYSRPSIRAFCNLFCDIHKAVQYLDGVIIKMQLIVYFTYFHSVSVTEIKNKQTNLNHFKKCTLKAEVNLSCFSLTGEIKAMQLNYYLCQEMEFHPFVWLDLNLKSVFLIIRLKFWVLNFNHIVPIYDFCTTLTHYSQLG